jgi:hypothetical protein
MEFHLQDSGIGDEELQRRDEERTNKASRNMPASISTDFSD